MTVPHVFGACLPELSKLQLLGCVWHLRVYAATANKTSNRGIYEMNIAIALYGLSGLFGFIAARIRGN